MVFFGVILINNIYEQRKWSRAHPCHVEAIDKKAFGLPSTALSQLTPVQKGAFGLSLTAVGHLSLVQKEP